MNPDPPIRRSLGAQRLHNIDAGSACRGQHRSDNRDQHGRRDGHRQCAPGIFTSTAEHSIEAVSLLPNCQVPHSPHLVPQAHQRAPQA